MKLTYLGHSGFLLEIDDKKLLFDPWIISNDKAAFDMDAVKKMDADFVFVTHGHRDHGFEEAVEISRDTKAQAIGVFELIRALKEKGGKGTGLNIGGSVTLDGVGIYAASAAHSCPYGAPCGFVVTYKGKTVYHAGDTGLLKDMELLSRLFSIDLAMLPIGGHFTMGLREFSLAKEMLKAKNYVAMHYGTFPPIETDIEKIKELADVMKPGETREY